MTPLAETLLTTAVLTVLLYEATNYKLKLTLKPKVRFELTFLTPLDPVALEVAFYNDPLGYYKKLLITTKSSAVVLRLND